MCCTYTNECRSDLQQINRLLFEQDYLHKVTAIFKNHICLIDIDNCQDD